MRRVDVRAWLLLAALVFGVQLVSYASATAGFSADPAPDPGHVQAHGIGADPDPLVDLTPPEVRTLGGASLSEFLEPAPIARVPLVAGQWTTRLESIDAADVERPHVPRLPGRSPPHATPTRR